MRVILEGGGFESVASPSMARQMSFGGWQDFLVESFAPYPEASHISGFPPKIASERPVDENTTHYPRVSWPEVVHQDTNWPESFDYVEEAQATGPGRARPGKDPRPDSFQLHPTGDPEGGRQRSCLWFTARSIMWDGPTWFQRLNVRRSTWGETRLLTLKTADPILDFQNGRSGAIASCRLTTTRQECECQT
ncbi:uncharacterized protein LY79DRAFT_271630 [Colletotrichum navitas]|uniref:Uncharacterized protein n=1 Tax=Colletotrichum navitas TaxID=681940 RepID=A0AAD8PVD9_9PEZI|nr:uncharacterized protein LY79DRAFT_271630 [Colletotrichum navitas]KAK1585356.1 hypothetical protein LY79DRAFT_271630 [Colletotrichum navitas]